MSNSAVFDVQPISRFQGTSVAIRRPKEISCFSYDDDHRYFSDDRSIRYYYPPRIGTNLCDGFDTFRQLDDTQDDHLDSLLRSIAGHEKETREKTDADIITWRGLMTKIMAMPYENNGFEMHATRFQDTIYIEESHEYKLKSRQTQLQQRMPPGMPSQAMMSFWGYKFEIMSTLPTPWDRSSRDFIETREEQVVHNYAQYCSIVKTSIGNTKLVLGGEVDAVWDKKPSDTEDPINWVELKTSALVENDRDILKYERKLLKFWIQSFLLGVPKIIVGMRSKRGILHHIEELETQKIPGMVKRNGKGTWDGNVCINFTAAFLEWLKTIIDREGVWRIKRKDCTSTIEVYHMQNDGHGKLLPADFVQWRKD